MHYSEFVEDDVSLEHHNIRREFEVTFSRVKRFRMPLRNMRRTSGNQLVQRLANLPRSVLFSSLVLQTRLMLLLLGL